MLPYLQRVLTQMGAQIRAARLRRRLTSVQVAERAGISRQTLYAIEKGASTVSLGNYAHTLLVLGLEKDLLQLAADDVLGRKLQDAALGTGQRAPRRSTRN
jgi:transcriptional regulator with XRE-family HTH domain